MRAIHPGDASAPSTRRDSSTRLRCSPLSIGVVLALLVALSHSACEESLPPVATATLGLSRSSVPLGGPLELNIRFDVMPDAAGVPEDYRVLIHFLDGNEELLWTEDHDPPEPTSTWEPGQTITYRRRITVPMYPYIGEAIVAVGLYSPATGTRLPLAGDDLGQQSYRVATVILEPQPESSFLVYDDGWHPAEFGPDGRNTWRWTTGRSVITFRNPRTDVALVLELEGRPDLFETPQRVALVIDRRTLHEFVLDAGEPLFVEPELEAADLGTADTVRLELHVDQTFTPAELGGDPKDTRELGARVSYAFLEPR